MPRVKFKHDYQKQFLSIVQKKSKYTVLELSSLVKVHPRTYRHWKRGEYNMSEEAFDTLKKISGEKPEPRKYTILPDYWNAKKAAHKAGLVVAKKYGGPGTPEGRKKGGAISQRMRRIHPEKYKHCNLKKQINKPPDSPELAEFMGIMLGDGGINSNHQITISLHKYDHKEYVVYVTELIKTLFNIKAATYEYRSERSKKVAGLTVSSTALIEFLIDKGLKKGNKVKNQVDVPQWIKNNNKYSRHCLRGLIDTDGCVYNHRHVSNGHPYYNIGLTFTNKSVPLLYFVYNTLRTQGFSAKLQKPKGVYLYRISDACRYADKVGFSNIYHDRRLKQFLKEKNKFKQGEVA